MKTSLESASEDEEAANILSKIVVSGQANLAPHYKDHKSSKSEIIANQIILTNSAAIVLPIEYNNLKSLHIYCDSL